MEPIIISILICSITEREEMLRNLLLNLMSQCGPVHHVIYLPSLTIYTFKNVEILICKDDKKLSTGAKRNMLYTEAIGDYSVSIDDDDEVPEYYVEELLKAAISGADCFAINGKITTNGRDEIKWRVSKDYDNITIIEDGRKVYLRKSNHITPIKTVHAKKVPFPNISNAEDKAFSDAVNPLLKTEFVIDKPMYHYKFLTYNKTY